LTKAGALADSAARTFDKARAFGDSDGGLEWWRLEIKNFMPGIKDKVVVITGASSESIRERAAG
jgi:hypothetical protein